MASLTGAFNSATTVARGGSVSGSAWGTPANALTNNGTRTRHTHTGAEPTGGYSLYLVVSDWSQRGSLPADLLSIDGVKVTVNCSDGAVVYNADGESVRTSVVHLYVSGSVGTGEPTTKDYATNWPTTASETDFTYGGTGEVWGETLNYAVCSASNFGFCISARHWDGDDGFGSITEARPDVDYIEMTVYYTPGASGQPTIRRHGLTKYLRQRPRKGERLFKTPGGILLPFQPGKVLVAA